MRPMTFGRGFIGTVCTVLVLGGAVAMAPTASAAACDPENLNSRSDFDGDGSADVAVGMPWYSDASGAVDIRGTGSPPLVLRSGAIGAGTGEGDRFGAAIAVGDLDQDGCADLAISAPAEGPTPGSAGTGGQVHIVFGGAGGLDLSTSVTLAHPSTVMSFGEQLALQRVEGGHDLYVSAPDSTVNGHVRAGEVFRYTITKDAATRVKATLREARSQDSAGVPGSAETGDRFGETLAATNRGGVLVGAPEEDIGKIRDAGGVWFLRVNAAGAPIASSSWSQDSPGVAGAAETNDRFGAALGSAGNVAVVGVPNEDSGSKADSGMIQTFTSTGSGTFTPGKGITQDTAGIPGALEAGDQFGAAVVVGTALLCQEAIDAAVGAPGEKIGTRAEAGLVTLINVDGIGGCPAKALRQGSGLAGAAETGDQVGGVLALTRRSADLEEDYSDRLLIGVPLEDIGAKTDAGMVQPAAGGITANGQLQEVLKFSQGYLQTDHYGLVLPSAVS